MAKKFDGNEDKLKKFVDRCLDVEMELARDSLKGRVESLLDGCESPIERLMAAALYFSNWPVGDYGVQYAPEQVGTYYPSILGSDWDHRELDIPSHVFDTVIIATQQKIGSYRVDFMVIHHDKLISDAINKVVVECDGHDFHERTKEQAARDRKRDREIQALGFKVFRFTGSEIYRDAYACAEEVASFFRKIRRG